MTRYDRRHWLLAVGMSAVAGYVDATGFMKLGGLFVSFMSGNSTRLGVGFVRDPDVASITVLLILAFVTGVVAGTLLARIAGPYQKPALLAFVGTMLAFAAAPDATLPVTAIAMLMTFAMGAANTVFQRDGEVSIGVTDMTGSLVKFGQRLEWFRQLGPAIRNLGRIARQNPVWAVQKIVFAPFRFARHLLGVLLLTVAVAVILILGSDAVMWYFGLLRYSTLVALVQVLIWLIVLLVPLRALFQPLILHYGQADQTDTHGSARFATEAEARDLTGDMGL